MILEKKFIDPNISRKGHIIDLHLEEQTAAEAPPIFSIIEFNLTGLCNRTCIFCPRANPNIYPNVNEHISLDLYQKIMKDLEEIGFNGTILYSAFGEPLLYKNIEILIQLSKKQCPNSGIEIVCNGDFVTADKLRKLFSAGLNVLAISMYDGPHQVEQFQSVKKEVGLTDDQVILRVRWLPPEEDFGITLSNRAGMVEMKDIGIVALKKPLKRPCYYPFYQILVDYDGSVLLCPHDWGKKLIVGNLKEHSLRDVWSNAMIGKVRQNLASGNRNFPPCNVCDVDGMRMGQSHFDRWMDYYRRQKAFEG